jgi:hypothetical protein
VGDTVQKLLRERAQDAGTGLLFEDQEWSWAEYVDAGTNKVLKRELVREGVDTTDELWVREERGTRYVRPPRQVRRT